MGKYILKRLGYIVVVFLIVSLLMYALYNLIPSDPARAQLEGQRKSLKPEEYTTLYNNLRESMGLNAPLIVRYARWMGLCPNVNGEWSGLLQGNFGYSQFFSQNVIDVM